ncbi:MAG: UDP-N-acetylmuramate dehydrogenase [Clostridia bacterium]|nr:UDP-N-acetylmuramate dehydrogenase [Clostridia bacterium]
MNIQKVKDDLENILQKDVLINEPMSKHTSFKIGGNADIYARAGNITEIIEVKDYANANNIPLTVIGNGSNLLVRDNGIRGIVLKIDSQDYKIIEDGERVYVTVSAGMLIGKLAHILLKNEITGFECFSGIPGTIGGAIKMNAGAYGGEFKDIVLSSKFLNEDNNIVTINNKEHLFEYRKSFFKDNSGVIIETKLELRKGEYDKIKLKMDEFLTSRREKQPIDMPSAGSTFKRGIDFITAKLIDEAGLKGYCIGGAKISDKHAGFIVNTGNATAQDVIDLINYTKKVVYDKFKERIQIEIEIIGE